MLIDTSERECGRRARRRHQGPHLRAPKEIDDDAQPNTHGARHGVDASGSANALPASIQYQTIGSSCLSPGFHAWQRTSPVCRCTSHFSQGRPYQTAFPWGGISNFHTQALSWTAQPEGGLSVRTTFTRCSWLITANPCTYRDSAHTARVASSRLTCGVGDDATSGRALGSGPIALGSTHRLHPTRANTSRARRPVITAKSTPHRAQRSSSLRPVTSPRKRPERRAAVPVEVEIKLVYATVLRARWTTYPARRIANAHVFSKARDGGRASRQLSVLSRSRRGTR